MVTTHKKNRRMVKMKQQHECRNIKYFARPLPWEDKPRLIYEQCIGCGKIINHELIALEKEKERQRHFFDVIKLVNSNPDFTEAQIWKMRRDKRYRQELDDKYTTLGFYLLLKRSGCDPLEFGPMMQWVEKLGPYAGMLKT